MKHPEWLGDKDLIEELLKKSGLYTVDKDSKLKLVMRCIIWSRYVEFMSVEETITKLCFDYNWDCSYSKYYRTLNKALELIEKRKKSET